MKTAQYDVITNKFFTTEINHNGIIGNEYGWHITGEGFYVIPNPHSKYVSFSKNHQDTCLGDIVSDIIPNYTNQQYADDYGDRITGLGKNVREFLQQNCRMDIK